MNLMRLFVVLFLTMLGLAATGCGGDGSSPQRLGTGPPLETNDRVAIVGGEVLDLVIGADVEAIWSRLDSRMRQAFPEEESLAGNFWLEVLGELGPPRELVSQQTDRFLGFDLYTAVYLFENSDAAIALRVYLDDEERIAGLNVVPLGEAPSKYLDYQTKTSLRLPFDGQWFVLNGGRTADLNLHAGHVDQRFAMDFVVVRDERTFRSDGLTNEDHFCFGEPVLAPAQGIVVQVIDDIADNDPGQRNEAEPAGNAVVLDHRNGEFSLVAHFQNGSVAVLEGASVEEGQLLGLCGNSGNSSEPHVHYHLQNGAALLQSEGLPAFFNDYVADGELVDRGEPVRGQAVSNP